jgi:hypothetical protein
LEKKFILTEETKQINDKIFNRIKAIRDFGEIKEGQLGWWKKKKISAMMVIVG